MSMYITCFVREGVEEIRVDLFEGLNQDTQVEVVSVVDQDEDVIKYIKVR